jgi:hypothetical protein
MKQIRAVFHLPWAPAALVGIFLLLCAGPCSTQADQPTWSMQAKKRAVRNLDKGSGV